MSVKFCLVCMCVHTHTHTHTCIHIHLAPLVVQHLSNTPAVQETQETWVQLLGWKDPIEGGMATLSSILAWRISWTEDHFNILVI